jgi:HSP20 family protein
MHSSFPSTDWLSAPEEGQLSIDVFRDKDHLIIRSTVAGVKPEDLDISLHGDLLTIRGTRHGGREIPEDQWYYRECYWGTFSRSVVLPYEVSSDQAQASLKNGVLEIKVPIREHGKKLAVKWEE